MSYLEQRVYNELAVPEELNSITIHTTDRHETPVAVDMPIFTATKDDDIEILVYTLERELIEYDHDKADPLHKNVNNDRKQHYHLTRLHPDRVKDGAKYLMPKGKGVYPFVPPMLVEKYENHDSIDTLYITEGYFKAFKASIHGLPIVGLSSITHYANSKTKRLHSAISQIIERCKVKNVVMLYDGDCLNISLKALERKEDLTKRPQGFLSSMLHVRELLADYKVDVWFANINTKELNNEPKGLDDMLCEYKGKEESIVASMLELDKPCIFLHKINITHNVKKLQPYFNLRNVDQFYNYWADIIGEKEFVYFGSNYAYKADEKKVVKTMPKELKNFIRVGDEYYEMVEVPVPYTTSYEGEGEIKMVQRKKSTITDDFGKEMMAKIPKFKAFVNIPSHTNYQRVIRNCWNEYAQIQHNPTPGDWRTTEMFLRHIFGEQYQLGLDYIQILYMYPTQILPILCLVSQERQTGKTTFIDFLKMIFGENCAMIGNAELNSQFNGFLASKLVVGVDETNVEKNREVTERIKMLSTLPRQMVNKKGVNQYEVWNFTKYILTSNFETNFIYTQSDEIRFWVRKVPHIETVIPTLLQDIYEEIPAFLYYLTSRKISVPKTSRMWFEAKDLETDALRRLKEQQKPLLEREIIEWARDTFMSFPDDEILHITPDVIRWYIHTAERKNTTEIDRILKESMQLKRVDKTTRPRVPQWDNPTAEYSTHKKSYRTFAPSRPYILHRTQVLTRYEIENLNKDENRTD